MIYHLPVVVYLILDYLGPNPKSLFSLFCYNFLCFACVFEHTYIKQVIVQKDV